MAGKTEEKVEQPAEKKPKGGKKMLIIGIVAVVLIINLAIAGTILIRKNNSKKDKGKKPIVKIGSKVALDEFLVNLSGDGDHYLKATFAIGVKEGVSADTITADTPPIRDAIISVLTTQTLADVSTEGGRNKLKKELVAQINSELGSDDVVTIYFLAFATQ